MPGPSRVLSLERSGTSWLERLGRGDIVLIDGGTGSELQRRGSAMSPAAWSALASRDHYELLREIHADFIRAGADIITTNTFGSARFVLAAAGCEHDFEMLVRRAVAAAREARATVAERPVAIAGSVSCLPPRFDVGRYPPPEAERAAYRELAALLADGGADLIALEMMQDAVHARYALEAALGTGLPVWLGVSARSEGGRLVCFDYPDRAFDSMLGELLGAGPAVVNVMHTPAADVGAALDAVRRHWDGPLGAYPELGESTAPGRAIEHAVPPAALVDLASGWVAAGVRLLGGCCGARPQHIAALAGARQRLLAARGAG